MTATPIPRTLALTVYGDLDVTEIARPPRGPQAGDHALGRRTSAAREAYTRLRRHLEEGRQAYVVCPLVSRVGDDRGARGRAGGRAPARRRAARLPRRLPPRPAHDRRSGARSWTRFKRGELDVLVATTVIEVGVDVPNATIMIVQEADRFGLAQLHQLRGRVGRGGGAVLLPARLPPEGGADRGRAAAAARRSSRPTDGFELAEVDLELRGEGQLLGDAPDRALRPRVRPAAPATARCSRRPARWSRAARRRGGRSIVEPLAPGGVTRLR